MRIKMQGGTVQNRQSSLCHTCRHATVVRGARLRDEIVECALLGYRHNRVTFSVTSCTDYVSRQHPSLREMEETAWILRTDAKRHRIGFVPSKELKPKDRFVFEED
jgi:hypothetical protein